MTMRVIGTTDQGMWRGKPTWQVCVLHNGRRKAVTAHGFTEDEAVEDALRTLARPSGVSEADRQVLRRINAALSEWTHT